jgi:proteic killer suppression protein
VIRQFKHKGLETFFHTGSTTGIQPAHAKRLRLILTALNQAGSIQDLNLPGLRLHPLRGNRKGYWAVNVSGNWRVIFRFDDGDAFHIDLVDYH